MRIAVCIKQVPVVAALAFDEEARTLKRSGVPTEVSAFDLRALARAADLKATCGAEVVVVTMGPPQAREALIEGLALGADRAIHLNDRAFAGADTLATAQALAACLSLEKPELILCGRYSVDAETAQVGPEVAELLGIAQITQVRKLEVDPASGWVRAERETDGGIEVVRTRMPVLVTVTEDIAPERFPSKADREAARGKPCVEVTAADLGGEIGRFGAAGSPTQVLTLQRIEPARRQEILSAAEPDSLANQLLDRLIENHGLFGEWRADQAGTLAKIHRPASASGPSGVWVLAEKNEAGIRPVTLELLGQARRLADAFPMPPGSEGRQPAARVAAVALGREWREWCQLLAAHGADEVLLHADERLVPPTAEVHAAALAEAIRRFAPRMVLMPSTSYGRDVAPRCAARLALGLTGDCIDLGLDASGRLLQLKPAFGGLVVAPIVSRTFPEMVTVRPGMLARLPADSRRSAAVTELDFAIEPPSVEVLEARTLAEAGADLDQAAIVIGLGKGIGGAEQIRSLSEVCSALNAAICATRDVVDEGWLPRHLQVGLTGRSIAPQLYLAVGIRGAFEHMVGVRRAGVIVAINRNARAPVFKSADYGIVGDYREILPALQSTWRARAAQVLAGSGPTNR